MEIWVCKKMDKFKLIPNNATPYPEHCMPDHKVMERLLAFLLSRKYVQDNGFFN